MDDEEMAAQVCACFLQDMPRQFADLKSALSAGDFETAALRAHAIKGAASNVGAERLRDVAAAIENMAREKHLSEAEAKVPNLENEFQTFKQTISQPGAWKNMAWLGQVPA